MNAPTQQAVIVTTLVVAGAAFAAWQYHEYGHECEREQSDLIQQSDVLRQALLGGVRAHRRLGRIFEEQMQGVIDELTTTPGVLAIRITDDSQWISLSAGQTESIESTEQSPLWQPRGLQTSEQATFSMMPPGPGGGGPAWRCNASNDGSPLQLRLTLLMDRTATDEAIRAAARMRVTVAIAGAMVLAAAVWIWLATLRVIRARTQAQLLEAETKRLKELSQAASGLAHETRNPLGVIRGGLQRLSRDNEAASEQRPKMQLLIEECDRVTARINQFLAYARPQSADVEAVALGPLLEELQALLQPDLEAKQLTLTLSIEPTVAAILADPNLLRQVLFNLLQNAIAFSPRGETVEVRVDKRQAKTVSIFVADRGPGVAKDQIPQLFSPYSTTRPDGAGLGLAIVKRLAAEQTWSVGHRNRRNGGAIFLIEGIRVANDSPNPDR